MQFHGKSIAQVSEALNTSSRSGLSAHEIARRQQEYGKNAMPARTAQANPFLIFLSQWRSPLILVLVVAGAISGALGETIDMTIIFITAFLNAVIGFIQEFKANSALKKLAALTSYTVVAIRDGRKVQVDAGELVPGDVVLLAAGQQVPADGRVARSEGLYINEAALTGESEPVQKQTDPVASKSSLGDRLCMVYRGTTVTSGEGLVLVTATGIDTEIGNIARLVHDTAEDETPLQRELAKLARQLTVIVVAIALAIFGIGLLVQGKGELLHLFETAVAVSVAAIPEGLVISLTVILAIGMQFILKRNALVRRLVAAETLGSVSVICTDKTGTLTEGNMRVHQLVTLARDVELSGSEQKVDNEMQHMISVAVLANEGELLNPEQDDSDWAFRGDTTDTAILAAGMHVGARQHDLQGTYPRKGLLPFRSDTKYVGVEVEEKGRRILMLKGAPEVLLSRSRHYMHRGEALQITPSIRQAYEEKIASFAAAGYRTIAVARRELSGQKELDSEHVAELTFLGCLVLADPLRKDVHETLQIAQRAGMRVIMITGDHLRTAEAIARKLGLSTEPERVCDGAKIDAMSDDELTAYLKKATVFARVNPKHKIRIVASLQQAGEVVAMTGDGINDAPALKGADIGVAVGSGTDVAKETADMVLLDDSFSTIVAAVEEGRGIYDNIKKVMVYMLSGTFAEVVMILGSILAGMPVAALPAQILWVNIIEDSFPTMSLAFEKTEKGSMKRPPRDKHEPLFSKEMKMIILLKSVLSNVALFAIFFYLYTTTADIALTRTVVFAGFAVDSLFLIFSMKQLGKQVWQYNPLGNVYLLAAVVFGWCMLLIAIYWAPLQRLLRTVSLGPFEWTLLIGFGLFNVILIESIKAYFIHQDKAHAE